MLTARPVDWLAFAAKARAMAQGRKRAGITREWNQARSLCKPQPTEYP
ncbi:hypothetical protein CF161_12601 [Pseudomonas sp. CF161]|nr:hypothetical protein CF161_12601 [Pseudomonas sp. CF161]